MAKNLKIAGWWLVIAGSLSIVLVCLGIFILFVFAEGLAIGFDRVHSAPLWLIWLPALVFSLPGLVSLLGGLSTLKHRRWGLALAGSISCLFCFSVLALPPCIFVIRGRSVFKTIRSGGPA